MMEAARDAPYSSLMSIISSSVIFSRFLEPNSSISANLGRRKKLAKRSQRFSSLNGLSSGKRRSRWASSCTAVKRSFSTLLFRIEIENHQRMLLISPGAHSENILGKISCKYHDTFSFQESQDTGNGSITTMPLLTKKVGSMDGIFKG